MLLNIVSSGSSGKPDFADFELISHNSRTYLASIGDRMSFFKHMEAKKAIWNRIWIICTIAFLITQSSTIIVAINPFENTLWVSIATALEQNGGLTGSMFYMSTLAMLFLHVPQLRDALMVFTKVGRMSLTCYLLHSIIGTLLDRKSVV